VDSDLVFEAVRRGYTELGNADPTEIQNYFDSVDPASVSGHVSNIKGILFEEEVVRALNEQGLSASLFDATNHPASDIGIYDSDELIGEIQLKATDSADYIRETLENNPDIPIVTTSEVAENTDLDVIDSGISNEDLTEAVEETLFTSALSDSSDDAVSELTDEAAGDLISDTVSDALSDVVSDSLADSISPIPITPIGLGISIVGALFGLIF
jgi:hypothetical protein